MKYSITAMAVFAAASLGAAMLLTTMDVAGRFFFNRPIGGTYELTELLMGFFAPVAIMYCAWKREHISVDIVYNFLPSLLKRLCLGLGAVIQLALAVLLSWQSIHLIIELMGSGTTTPVLALPYWPTGVSIALSFVYMVLIYSMDLLRFFGGAELETEAGHGGEL